MFRGRSRAGGSRVWSTAAALALAAWFLAPLAWVVIASFQPTRDFAATTKRFIPENWTFENYGLVGSQLTPLLTTLLIATLSAALALAVGIPAAYALSSFRWRWAALAGFFILITQVVPTGLVLTPLFLLFSELRLVNTVGGVVLGVSTIAIPFTVLVLTPFMADLPGELREAAMIDGAGEWRTLVSVIVPASRTAIIAAGLFSFLFGWGDFLWSLTLNTSGRVIPLSVSIHQFIGAYTVQWGAIMAAAAIALIPAIVLLVGAQRYIALGLTGGAVKE